MLLLSMHFHMSTRKSSPSLYSVLLHGCGRMELMLPVRIALRVTYCCGDHQESLEVSAGRLFLHMKRCWKLQNELRSRWIRRRSPCKGRQAPATPIPEHD